jgi:predicted PhzF superfamily epimerase YddE/YHI9
MPRLHILRVFCSDDGAGGNGLGAFLEGHAVSADHRQAVAADLGLSETVFVDDAAAGAFRIFTPAVELNFAGHPSVGTAWLLARERSRVECLRVQAGELPVRYEDDLPFVTARPGWGPPWELIQLDSPAEVDALDAASPVHDLGLTWAWLDEGHGIVRARAFGRRIGIAEDEATGSAAVRLCARLGRAIDIHQGRGSRILARPVGDGHAEIGGRSVLDDVRDYALPAFR